MKSLACSVSSTLLTLALLVGLAAAPVAGQDSAGLRSLRLGSPLPDATLLGRDGKTVRLADNKGRVRILSVVPQLNTPVCDEQTHRFSEQNGGLDRDVDILTLSTNTWDDQRLFASKAKIRNISFLSDAPAYDFGKKTGLLVPRMGILHRAVIITDDENVIRYVEMVPMGQLPNFDAALSAARRLLRKA